MPPADPVVREIYGLSLAINIVHRLFTYIQQHKSRPQAKQCPQSWLIFQQKLPMRQQPFFCYQNNILIVWHSACWSSGEREDLRPCGEPPAYSSISPSYRSSCLSTLQRTRQEVWHAFAKHNCIYEFICSASTILWGNSLFHAINIVHILFTNIQQHKSRPQAKQCSQSWLIFQQRLACRPEENRAKIEEKGAKDTVQDTAVDRRLS